MSNIVILGNGPAGVSASLYTARAGIETTIIARDFGALAKAERIENYYGFKEQVSGMDLVRAGIAQAGRVGVTFVEEEAVGIGFGETLFVKTEQGSYAADSLILATGSARAAPKIEGLNALEGRGVSYCAVCDAFFYRGKDVAVLGSGAYARNEVEELLPLVHSVTLLTHGAEPEISFPEAVRVVKTAVSAFAGGERLERVQLADGGEIPVQGVFVACGAAGSADFAKKVGAMTQGNRILVDENMATNVPGLFAAGDCTGGMLQIAKAVYEGAVAGTEAVKYIRNSKK